MPRPLQRLRTRALPHDDARCGWFPPPGENGEAGEAGEAGTAGRAPLEDDLTADAVVIGAGLTGLAAARRLAELEPGGRVVVLDAQRAGHGASARSSGFVVDIAYFTTAMEPAAAARHVRLSRAGIAALRRQVADHEIDCAWDDTGWIHAAAGADGLADLATLAAWLDAQGEAYDDLDQDGMERATGSRFYRRGIRMPGRPLLQPADLLRGLVRSLPASVELHEHTPVRALDRLPGGGWTVTTDRATVTTPRVILAANGYTPGLGALGREVFPLITFGSMTRRLTDSELDALGGEREWGLLAQDAMGSSLRRTRDQRILVRNTLHYSRDFDAPDAVRERARTAHREALARRWPALFGSPGPPRPAREPIELETTWAGVMGASASRRHQFGQLDDGLWAAAGFTGAGIAMGTISGELLAEWAHGDESALLRDMRALPGPGRTPPEPFLSLGIRWKVSRMNASAGDWV